MKNYFFIVNILFLILLLFNCNDGIYGNCTSLADKYCSGVEDCTDPEGDKYIKVGSERYYCAESLQYENSFDCSGALAEARQYCEGLNPGPEEDVQCYKTDLSGKVTCYGMLLSKDQCDACGWSYSAVTCDEYAGAVTYSPPNCN